MLLTRVAALFVAGAVACGSGAAHDAASTASPPDSGPPDVELVEASTGVLVVRPAQFTTESMPMRMLSAGDPIDLWNAPQGGHVVLLGAKVLNLASDTVTLKVRARDPGTGVILAEEGRTVKMVPVEDEPGVMQPDLRTRSQVSNVPLCPNYDHMAIVDREVDVTVYVTALYTDPVQTGETTMRLVPTCSTPDDEAFCRCDCEADYFLGKCGEDGGPDARAPASDSGAGD